MTSQDCFICRKHKGELYVHGGCIYEDEWVYAGHIGANDPLVYLGYLIVDSYPPHPEISRHTRILLAPDSYSRL